MNLLCAMAAALTLTLFFELLFALIWGVRNKGLLLVIRMNLLTNPAVNLLWFFSRQVGWASNQLLIVLELAVVAIEGLCCRGMIKRPWLFALFVNLFSYTAGELIQFLL